MQVNAPARFYYHTKLVNQHSDLAFKNMFPQIFPSNGSYVMILLLLVTALYQRDHNYASEYAYN